jgi:hypothetical protein
MRYSDPTMSETLSYRARLNVLEGERTYRLAPEALVIDYGDGAPPEVLRYEDISQLRLRYFPTRSQWNRFECLLTGPGRGRFRIGSEYYRGVMHFEDRGPEYREFVRELCLRLADAGAPTRFLTGRPIWVLLAESAFLMSMVALLAVALILVGGVVGALPGIRLVLLAASLPLLWFYFRRNRPGSFDPRDVPALFLPPE